MSAVPLSHQPGLKNDDWAQRAVAIDWPTTTEALHQQGNAVLPQLLSATECAALARLYGNADESTFRSRVVMQRHGFGQGEYRYFSYPLPGVVAGLREALYPHLAPIANQWNTAMGIDVRYPTRHADFIARCHAAGQVRPTPLLLQYGPGDYNCLHQDLYGEHVFPLQVAVLLSEPGRDFTGGEFVLTAHAIAGRGGAAAAWRRRGVCRAPPPRAGHARAVPRADAPWREPVAQRAAAHPWHHFSRC